MTEPTPSTKAVNTNSPEKKPLYKRTWFIVLAAILLISAIGNANNGGSEVASEPQATVTVTATPESAASESATEVAETPEASATPEETVNVDSDFNVANFRTSAKGNIADLKKDLNDLKNRAEEGSLLRLLGNVLEISFNQGQLEALTDVPTKISKSWPTEVANLAAAVDALSDETSSFVAGDASLASLKKAISKVNGIADKLSSLVGKL